MIQKQWVVLSHQQEANRQDADHAAHFSEVNGDKEATRTEQAADGLDHHCEKLWVSERVIEAPLEFRVREAKLQQSLDVRRVEFGALEEHVIAEENHEAGDKHATKVVVPRELIGEVLDDSSDEHQCHNDEVHLLVGSDICL